MNRFFALFLTFSIVALSVFATLPAAANDSYKLRQGDVIQVIVLEDPELTQGALVRPDGKISLPIAGTLQAEGRTPEQLQATIRSRLASNFIEPPTVSVSVSSVVPDEEELEEEEPTRSFYVVGEVVRPGRFAYEADETVSVLQALSLAGGMSAFAARQRIQVREVVDEVEAVRLFDYDAVEKGLGIRPEDLASLADGAVILVPERGLFE